MQSSLLEPPASLAGGLPSCGTIDHGGEAFGAADGFLFRRRPETNHAKASTGGPGAFCAAEGDLPGRFWLSRPAERSSFRRINLTMKTFLKFRGNLGSAAR